VDGAFEIPSACAAAPTSTMPRAVRIPRWSREPSRRVVKVIPRVALATSAGLASAAKVGAATVAAAAPAVPARKALREGFICRSS